MSFMITTKKCLSKWFILLWKNIGYWIWRSAKFKLDKFLMAYLMFKFLFCKNKVTFIKRLIFRLNQKGHKILLKDTHREESILKQNSNFFQKYEYVHLVRWYIKSNLYTRKLKTKFLRKYSSYLQNSVLYDRSIWYSLLASDRAVLYGNVAFSILVLLTKKRRRASRNFLRQGSFLDLRHFDKQSCATRKRNFILNEILNS